MGAEYAAGKCAEGVGCAAVREAAVRQQQWVMSLQHSRAVSGVGMA